MLMRGVVQPMLTHTRCSNTTTTATTTVIIVFVAVLNHAAFTC
jgi:hypothetical protein